MTKISDEYILTTSTLEDDRLKRQHDLWLADTLAFWKKARLGAHQKILELGCGPGHTTLDLARYLGPSCNITSVELSTRFAEECRKRVSAYKNISILNEDLHQITLEPASFDACYGRWVFMFIPNPEKVLEKIVHCLKPGGTLLLQEYVDYSAMDLSPTSPIMEKTVKIIRKSFSDAGGDANITRKLVRYMEELGLKVETLEAQGKIIRPHEPFWDWPTQFFQGYLETLKQKNYLTANDVEEFHQNLEASSRTPGCFLIAPTVAHIIARKPA